jgi:hypothetical protein
MAQWVRSVMQKVKKKENLGVKMNNYNFGMGFTMDMHVLMHTHIHQQLCKEQFSKGMWQWFSHYIGTLFYVNTVIIHCLSACLSLSMQQTACLLAMTCACESRGNISSTFHNLSSKNLILTSIHWTKTNSTMLHAVMLKCSQWCDLPDKIMSLYKSPILMQKRMYKGEGKTTSHHNNVTHTHSTKLAEAIN